jgi:MoaA/NifB/PqqE/SkfB family radical SAM enzyme
MPRFRTLLLSGGEPTLRSDLPEVINVFSENNNIENASVPTNGLSPERIAKIAEDIVLIAPELNITFSVSIDGFSHLHDLNRGVEGCFSLAMETLEKLGVIANSYDNFNVFVNTVIFSDNYREVVDFANYINSTDLVDGHFFEIIRGQPLGEGLKSVPPQALDTIYQELIPIQAKYLYDQASCAGNYLLNTWRAISSIGNLIYRYKHQLRVYSSRGKWDFPCLAGESIGVIDYDGEVRICELRNKRVPLEDYDYDFSEVWKSKEIRDESQIAKSHSCDCTHTCFLGLSMRQHVIARFFYSPWLYFINRIKGNF